MPTPLTMYRTELNGYRENVMNAWKAYQEAIDALGDTQGTDYYKDGEQAAAATRDAAITAARSAAIEKLNMWTEHMQENASKIKTPAITEDGLRVVQALTMKAGLRELTRDDIADATATIEDDPAAMDMLRDLASAKHITGVSGILHREAVTRQQATEAAAALTRWASNVISARRFYDSSVDRCQAYYNPNGYETLNVAAGRYDRSFSSDAEMLQRIAGDSREPLMTALNGTLCIQIRDDM
jgi:hypothetical protein